MISFLNDINKDDSEIFRVIPLMLAPRVLGLMDRNPESASYGSVDRHYWKYKVHDFKNLRYQEAAHFLLMLFNSKGNGNPYYRNDTVKDLIKASVNYWLSSRNSDGSVTEVYPYERSFCATSFSTYAVSEAMLAMRDFLYDQSIIKTGDWLLKSVSANNPNQTAGAAIALYNIYLLCGEKRFRDGAEEKSRILVTMMDNEGCFIEYGGQDLGYHSITMSVICSLFRKNASEALANCIEKGLLFCEKNLDDSGRALKKEWSRRTQFFYPSFLAATKRHDLLVKVKKGLLEYVAMNPVWIDDRYMIPYATDYLITSEMIRGERS